MDGLNQRRDALGWGMLRNAVPKIENVPGIAAAVTIQNFACFACDNVWRRKKHRGIEITLQRNALTNPTTRFAQFDRPVQTDGITPTIGDVFQPQTAPFGEHDNRDTFAIALANQTGENLPQIGQ